MSINLDSVDWEDFEETISYLKKVFELSPQDAHIPWEIGDTCRLLRRYHEAEGYFDRSISLAPDQTTAYILKVSNYRLQGLLAKARATLEEMPKKTDLESIGDWHIRWAWQEIYERNYQAALELLSSDFVESYRGEKAYNAGWVYWLMNKPELARDSFDSARVRYERRVKELPDSSSTHRVLGYIYAGLGRKEEAIREGKLAVELYPVSKDAFWGPRNTFALALIYAMVGEYEEALNKIEYLLSIPCTLSVPLLRIDPRWDPLREHPGFKRLLEKYSEKEE